MLPKYFKSPVFEPLHNLTFARSFIIDAAKMEQTMDNDAMQLHLVRGADEA